jgi:dihydropteroate synthase
MVPERAMLDVPIIGGCLRSDRMLIMGILNATPDSFSDGGELNEVGIDRILKESPDIIDVGGESTRPGHKVVSVAEEISRVKPIIENLRWKSAVPISIDTTKPAVARAALDSGANFINDVSGLVDPKMRQLVASEGCAVVVMRHRALEGEIVTACEQELTEIIAVSLDAGIQSEQLILDPGLGFGNRPGPSVADNFSLIDNIPHYSNGFPVLIGGSRKRFIGEWMGEPDAKKRLRGSLEVVRRAKLAGAAIVRVHDVAASQCV